MFYFSNKYYYYYFTKGCPLMRIDSKGFAHTEMLYKAVEKQDVPNKEWLLDHLSEYTRTMLFDLEKDPQQLQPLDDPETEERMIRLMVRLMKDNDAPQEQYERLELTDYL